MKEDCATRAPFRDGILSFIDINCTRGSSADSIAAVRTNKQLAVAVVGTVAFTQNLQQHLQAQRQL